MTRGCREAPSARAPSIPLQSAELGDREPHTGFQSGCPGCRGLSSEPDLHIRSQGHRGQKLSGDLSVAVPPLCHAGRHCGAFAPAVPPPAQPLRPPIPPSLLPSLSLSTGIASHSLRRSTPGSVCLPPGCTEANPILRAALGHTGLLTATCMCNECAPGLLGRCGHAPRPPTHLRSEQGTPSQACPHELGASAPCSWHPPLPGTQWALTGQAWNEQPQGWKQGRGGSRGANGRGFPGSRRSPVRPVY